MRKKIIITVDVEEDISIYLENSYLGITNGILPLLNILDKFAVSGDFFITADVCLKYPQLMKTIFDSGHNIGCHGYNHELLCTKDFNRQYSELKKATEVIETIIGERPKMFRAPNFSVNGNTIKALEKLDYIIDSSICPGRVYKKLRLFTIYNFKNAPVVPYNPSRDDVRVRGNSSIFEIPLTENPLIKGTPIGAGYLNTYGYNSLIESIEKVKTENVLYLIHPWELIDLGYYYKNIKKSLHKSCSSKLLQFESFLEYANKNHTFVNLKEII